MSHESATERFFERGIENYSTFHGNYLNFGLWEDGITDYVKAAENMLVRVAKKIGLDKDSVLLDVACGMGAQDLFFMREFRCKSIEALDLTRKHIELAIKKNTERNVKYRIGNACSLPFKDKSFTHMTGIEDPVNFNTREQFFKEVYRVLKKRREVGHVRFPFGEAPKGQDRKKIAGSLHEVVAYSQRECGSFL